MQQTNLEYKYRVAAFGLHVYRTRHDLQYACL